MPTPPLNYNQYYLPPQHQMPPQYQPQMVQHGDPNLAPQLQHQQPAPMQVDPALALYHPTFYSYPPQNPSPPQQPQPQQPSPQQPLHQQLTLTTQSPSSSQASEHIETPPEAASSSRQAGSVKRPPSHLSIGNRKKVRTDDKEDEDEEMSPAVEKEEAKAKATRGSRACTVCRRLKMKCVGAEQGPPCKRCQAGNHECVFEESNRGKRSANSVRKHEQLTRSLRKMERTLDTVLRTINNPGLTSLASGMVSRSPSPSLQAAGAQALLESPSPSQQSLRSPSTHVEGSPRLHSLPDNSLNPLGLLAEASLSNRRTNSSHSAARSPSSAPKQNANDEQNVGVASEAYFKPGPMTILPLRRLYIERQVQPEMLNFVSTPEVVDLFRIYFNHMNLHCSLLDRDFHTPSLVCSRSPFLLTTICAISSKFYPNRPELHSRLTDLAKKLAFSVPERGYKSVEIVQAYLLLSLWGCGPVERYEQDKTWILLGMAIRTATDLNLHRKTAMSRVDTPEGRARDQEVHNRERTWLMCFILDRSLSMQMGKPTSIREDAIIRSASQWWKQHTANKTDIGVVAYADLQRILSRSLELLYSGTSSASGLQTDCDYYLVVRTIEAQILEWKQEWEFKGLLLEQADTDPFVAYRLLFARFYFHYAMLVVNSFGLQNALERSRVDLNHFFVRVHSSATACAMLVRDQIGPSGFLRYSPDSHFVLCSYAVLSLLKLVRPEFSQFMEDEQKTISLVNDVADLLENVAVSPLHTPALYSTLLKALISARVNGTSRAGSPDHTTSNGSKREVGSGDVGGPGVALNPDTSTRSPFLSHHPEIVPNTVDFQFNGEMGPVADISTFPPTMAPNNQAEDASNMLSMDSILSTGFWDSVLVPGYSNVLEGLSGGFVYGAGGSGLITSRLGSPVVSGSNTPTVGNRGPEFTQNKLNAAFNANTDDSLKVS